MSTDAPLSLRATGVDVELSALGGRVSSISIGGLEVLGGVSLDGVPAGISSGCFPMAPYAGRVRGGTFDFDGSHVELPQQLNGHAIHGLLWDVVWDVEGPGRLRADLGDRWPFGGSARQTYSLSDDSFTSRLTVTADHRAMPYSLGYHPWFRRRLSRGGDLQMTLSLDQQYLTDPTGLPTGGLGAPEPGPWDDCFTLSGPEQVLHWPGALSLRMRSDAANLVVFDALEDVVCVEPQSAPPDAVNLGLHSILEPHQSATISMALTWQLH